METYEWQSDAPAPEGPPFATRISAGVQPDQSGRPPARDAGERARAAGAICEPLPLLAGGWLELVVAEENHLAADS